ncbi:hypothetical protein EM6_3324 (plasmid) [Asticcacaulis excentricus]|uniref:Uncharacterized protein n=1 Tax=Asticcacaulis excentricus TaxID=78587 RepID=A0A3G9GBH5_9CAUL|nr:hypothetical protein EM6_3324 [Asticcacaulis excentricus]
MPADFGRYSRLRKQPEDSFNIGESGRGEINLTAGFEDIAYRL